MFGIDINKRSGHYSNNDLKKWEVRPPANITKIGAFQFIEKNSSSFFLLPQILKNDIELASLAIDKLVDNYAYLSDSVRKNKDLTIQALTKNSLMIQYVPEKLKTDIDIIEITLFKKAYEPAVETESLKNDYINSLDWAKLKASLPPIKSFPKMKHTTIMAVAPQHPPASILTGYTSGVAPIKTSFTQTKLRDDILKFFPDSIKANRDIVLKTVQLAGQRLQSASTELTNDKEIALAALKDNIGYMDYVGKELKEEIGNSNPIEYLTSHLLYEKIDENTPHKDNFKIKKKI